jgi:hypothetical protein
MDSIPIQCKRLRRSIRRKRHVFMKWLNRSSFCPPGSSMIVVDFLLPSRHFANVLEAEARKGTRFIVYQSWKESCIPLNTQDGLMNDIYSSHRLLIRDSGNAMYETYLTCIWVSQSTHRNGSQHATG